MNNEPVAWMYEDASGTMKMLGNTRLEEWVTKFGCKEIPLYTHPAKTLTEIDYVDFLPIWKEFIKDANSVLNVQMVAHYFYNLALRKAQE
jgi:hypothetical protein